MTYLKLKSQSGSTSLTTLSGGRMGREGLLRACQGGFSLIETVVSLFVFSIMIVMAGTIFTFVFRLQGRALNMQKVQENSQFILETMGREIRVANCISNDPACQDSNQRLPDNNCSNPRTDITIQHPVNGTVNYSLAGQTILRTVGSQSSQLSSNNVRIANLNFCIQHNSSIDLRQPEVTIILGLETGFGKDKISTALQTTLSQRFLKD